MGGVAAEYGCDCSTAGNGPDDSSPVFFHGRTRKDATMKIVLLILLCLVSSPTSHSGPNSILQLFTKAPVVVVHCRPLFGAKKTQIMLVGTLLKLLFASFFSCVYRLAWAIKRQKLRCSNASFGVMGQVLSKV